ncbi:MAG: putative coiled-coil protein SlyX [Gammaproteobacteria bacterium]|jgi:uncharacterized coiled-coil protein SlyX
MNSQDLDQIAKLEILFSEQEYTVQVLNEIVTRQDLDIAKLKSDYQELKHQYLDLKSQLPDQATGPELPPHY